MTNLTKLKRSSKNMTEQLRSLRNIENQLLNKLSNVQGRIKQIEIAKINCKKKIKEMKNK